jgi:hypothetical protein
MERMDGTMCCVNGFITPKLVDEEQRREGGRDHENFGRS